VSNDTPKIGSKEFKFDFLHTPRNISVDNVPAQLKVQDLKIARWTLQKDVQILDESGNYYQTTTSEAQRQSRPFNNYSNGIFVQRIQGCLCIVLQIFQMNTSPHYSTLEKIGYNNIAFSLELVSDES